MVGASDEERLARHLTGTPRRLVDLIAVGVGLFAIHQVFRPLSQGTQYYLILFLAAVLPLTFLCYRSGLTLPTWLRPRRGRAAGAGDTGTAATDEAVENPRSDAVGARWRENPSPLDWVLAGVALLVCLYPVLPVSLGDAGGGFNAFLDRQGSLVLLDVVMGGILLVLILEACRRATGWALPVVCLLFLAYSYYGGYLPASWAIAHLGVDFDQIINGLYNNQSGFYGVPLDVAATYIVLFTIYGGVLELSGAGRFFVDLSVAAFRRSTTAAGRTTVAAGFLLGSVSGSGSATAVSIGTVTWPILRRAGYPPEPAGGMLAAAGIGAILSPPTLGAAAFIIAEYLGVSYLTVLGWALIPTLLYYLGILLAVEFDARRFGVRPVEVAAASPWRLLGRFGYHFLSLFVIVALLAMNISATRAVVYATGVALLLSFLDRSHWPTPRRLYTALADSVRAVIPVVAVCAAAGVITSTITRTGLGLQLASLLVRGAESITEHPTAVLALTVLFAAIAVSLLGLAVPVTASFIIAWVIIAPALLDLDVSAPQVAMFVFYYAVLSEVTPPTALAAVSAAAITGGRVMATMMQAARYALPAFCVPIAFVLTDAGAYLLGRGGPSDIAWAVGVAAIAVVALAMTTAGWIRRQASPGERVLTGAAAVLLLYLAPVTIAIGLCALVVAVVLHLMRVSRQAARRSEAGHDTVPAGGERVTVPVDGDRRPDPPNPRKENP